MPVALLLAAIAILAGVVVVAIGRGGELTISRSDVPPLRLEFATAADLARFRPPPAFFGYSAQVTDDALQRIARVVADREAELASLRRQLAALGAGSPPASYPLASSAAAAAGVVDASIPPARPPEPGGWPEHGGWAESEPEPESGGWPESESGTGPVGWAESESGTGPVGWAESGSEAGTGPSGWDESEFGSGAGTGLGDWTGSGAWPEDDTAAEPGTGTVTHGEGLDAGPGPEPGSGPRPGPGPEAGPGLGEPGR